MKVNTLDIPKEGYEISNHAQGGFGPAKFEEAGFHLISSPTAKMEMITVVSK